MADGTPSQGSAPENTRGVENERWLDRPNNINLIVKILVAACALSVVTDFFVHKHADYGFQAWIAFDAGFGFLAYVGLITAAKLFRRLVMRDEDYYD